MVPVLLELSVVAVVSDGALVVAVVDVIVDSVSVVVDDVIVVAAVDCVTDTQGCSRLSLAGDFTRGHPSLSLCSTSPPWCRLTGSDSPTCPFCYNCGL